jgi:pimeloyl-ACP methyl ester carboxylesterase
VEEYVNFVQKKIRDQGSGIVLLGHSFGGQVAAYLAAKHPELVEKLILTGPALFRPPRKVKRLIFGTIAKVGKRIFRLPFIEKWDVAAKKLLYKAADSPDFGEMAGIKQEIFKKIIREDLTCVLPQISTPTLLVWGTDDTYTPFTNAKRALALIPHATLHMIEGGKHGLHLQQPEELLRVIRNFVC